MILSCLPEVCNNSPRAPDPSRVGRHTRQGCARELAVWDLPQQQLDLANVAGTIVHVVAPVVETLSAVKKNLQQGDYTQTTQMHPVRKARVPSPLNALLPA